MLVDGWVGKLFKEWNLVLARKTYNALKHFTEKILYFITKSMQYVEYICFKNWKECARNYTLRNFSLLMMAASSLLLL